MDVVPVRRGSQAETGSLEPPRRCSRRLGTTFSLGALAALLQDKQSTLYRRYRSWKFFSDYGDPFTCRPQGKQTRIVFGGPFFATPRHQCSPSGYDTIQFLIAAIRSGAERTRGDIPHQPAARMQALTPSTKTSRITAPMRAAS
jgi:hypothetical protein